MPEHIEVTVAGVTYNNVRQAWRELSPDGLPEITVRKRLDAGWPTLVAFTLAPLPPEMRRLGHEEMLPIQDDTRF